MNVYRLSTEWWPGVSRPCLRSLHFPSRFHSWDGRRLSTKRDVFDVKKRHSSLYRLYRLYSYRLTTCLRLASSRHPGQAFQAFFVLLTQTRIILHDTYLLPETRTKKHKTRTEIRAGLEEKIRVLQAKLCGATWPHHIEHAETAHILRYGFGWWFVHKASSQLWRQAATDASSAPLKPNQGKTINPSNWQLNNLISQFGKEKKSACSHLPCPKPEAPSTENSHTHPDATLLLPATIPELPLCNPFVLQTQPRWPQGRTEHPSSDCERRQSLLGQVTKAFTYVECVRPKNVSARWQKSIAKSNAACCWPDRNSSTAWISQCKLFTQKAKATTFSLSFSSSYLFFFAVFSLLSSLFSVLFSLLFCFSLFLPSPSSSWGALCGPDTQAASSKKRILPSPSSSSFSPYHASESSSVLCFAVHFWATFLLFLEFFLFLLVKTGFLSQNS